jgi:hypothetical protein
MEFWLGKGYHQNVYSHPPVYHTSTTPRTPRTQGDGQAAAAEQHRHAGINGVSGDADPLSDDEGSPRPEEAHEGERRPRQLDCFEELPELGGALADLAARAADPLAFLRPDATVSQSARTAARVSVLSCVDCAYNGGSVATQ